jgi:hypothetical protein
MQFTHQTNIINRHVIHAYPSGGYAVVKETQDGVIDFEDSSVRLFASLHDAHKYSQRRNAETVGTIATL